MGGGVVEGGKEKERVITKKLSPFSCTVTMLPYICHMSNCLRELSVFCMHAILIYFLIYTNSK